MLTYRQTAKENWYVHTKENKSMVFLEKQMEPEIIMLSE